MGRAGGVLGIVGRSRTTFKRERAGLQSIRYAATFTSLTLLRARANGHPVFLRDITRRGAHSGRRALRWSGLRALVFYTLREDGDG